MRAIFRNLVFVGVLGLTLAAPGQAAGPAPQSYLSTDAKDRTAHLTVLAGLGSKNNGFNFDGYGRGELSVTVPLGWRLVVECENRGETRASCVLVSGPQADRPAFPGATVPQPTQGLAPGAAAEFTVVLTRTGSFRIASLVPGQEQARMWDVLEVTRVARPSISARPGP